MSANFCNSKINQCKHSDRQMDKLCMHANPRETKSGRGLGLGGLPLPKRKDAKWCIMLHFGYTICSVKSLNINVV